MSSRYPGLLVVAAGRCRYHKLTLPPQVSNLEDPGSEPGGSANSPRRHGIKRADRENRTPTFCLEGRGTAIMQHQHQYTYFSVLCTRRQPHEEEHGKFYTWKRRGESNPHYLPAYEAGETPFLYPRKYLNLDSNQTIGPYESPTFPRTTGIVSEETLICP